MFSFNTSDKRLKQVCKYYLGDYINKFLPGEPAHPAIYIYLQFPDCSIDDTGALTSQSVSDNRLQTEQMFFTSTGCIGVISKFDERLSLHMTALQRNLGNFILGPGEVRHSKCVDC